MSEPPEGWARLEWMVSETGLFAVSSPDEPGLLLVDRDPVELLKAVPAALKALRAERKET